MKLEECFLGLRSGGSMRRGKWVKGRHLSQVGGTFHIDSISMEDFLANDWEIVGEPEPKKHEHRYPRPFENTISDSILRIGTSGGQVICGEMTFDIPPCLDPLCPDKPESPENTRIKSQIDLLANFIMTEVPGEPSQSEGAGATAIRLIKNYRHAFLQITRELGIPGDGYPAPVSNAYDIAKAALDGNCIVQPRMPVDGQKTANAGREVVSTDSPECEHECSCTSGMKHFCVKCLGDPDLPKPMAHNPSEQPVRVGECEHKYTITAYQAIDPPIASEVKGD